MILVYNPTCEMAVRADTVNYQPPAPLVAFEQKWAPLMMFFASSASDAVVGASPSDEVLSFWRDKGAIVPQFISLSEAKKRVCSGEMLRPWGISKEVLYRFGGHELSAQFTTEHRQLFSRLSSVALDDALAQLKLPTWCQQTERPQVFRSADELHHRIQLRPCVLKSLWSASGRGVTIVDKAEYVPSTFRRYEAYMRTDSAVVVEPLLHRLVDFAMLFSLASDGSVTYCGKNFYRSDKSGKFGVELIGYNPLQPYEDSGDLPSDWEQVASQLFSNAIRSLGWHKLYCGPVGVDSMLYSDECGRIKMRLCIEANLRYTMGNINMAIAQVLGNGVQMEWGIGNGAEFSFLPHSRESFI